MARSITYHVIFAGGEYETQFHHGLAGPTWTPRATNPGGNPTDGWNIDLPTVTAMLSAVDRGEATAAEALQVIHGCLEDMVTNSGCCLECEDAFGPYRKALADYAAAKAAMEARAVADDTYPYLVNVGLTKPTVHAFNCPMAPAEEIPHPGASLHEFAHRTEPRWAQYAPEPRSVRMTPDELTAWIRARRGKYGGKNYHRCLTCQPVLPVAYESEAAG